MTIRPFLHLPPPGTFGSLSDVAAYSRRLWDALHAVRLGKLEVVGEVTLTAGAATTVFNRKGISNQTAFGFDPRTANAAAELAAGTMYILDANRGADAVTITHANNGQTDRVFFVSCIG